MGVGPHVLLSGMELARSGIVAAVEQSCVIVGMRLKQQSDEIILELAQGKGFSYAILVSTAENPAQFPAQFPKALSGRASQAEVGSEHQVRMYLAVEHSLELIVQQGTWQSKKESAITWRSDYLHLLQRRLDESMFGIDRDALLFNAMHPQSVA